MDLVRYSCCPFVWCLVLICFPYGSQSLTCFPVPGVMEGVYVQESAREHFSTSGRKMQTVSNFVLHNCLTQILVLQFHKPETRPGGEIALEQESYFQTLVNLCISLRIFLHRFESSVPTNQVVVFSVQLVQFIVCCRRSVTNSSTRLKDTPCRGNIMCSMTSTPQSQLSMP